MLKNDFYQVIQVDEQYRRLVQTSVTCFVYCGDEYLFLKRKDTKRIDPGRLNGVGGRVEPGENYLDAAIREVNEETGYIVKRSDVRLCGVVKLEGGYEDDWVMCFFKIRVPSKKIPLGDNTEDGKLMWFKKDDVLNSGYELVDDLNYSWKEIAGSERILFITARLDANQKVVHISKNAVD